MVRRGGLVTLLLAAVATTVVATWSIAVGATPVGTAVQVSTTGTYPDTTRGANDPRIAYNQTNDQFLVVWSAGVSGGETEIYGRILDGAGNPVAAQFQISFMGPPGDPAFRGLRPDVTWNAQANEYYVAWIGREDPVAATDTAIYGRRVSAAGVLVDTAKRISAVGFQTFIPSIAYNSVQNEYLVVFHRKVFAAGDQDVFAQRVAADGTEVGVDDFQLSALGGTDQFTAEPRVAYNAVQNEYLVAWTGDVAAGGLADSEAFAQRVTGAGAEIGPDDQRISDAAPDGGALPLGVVWNAAAGEYLVGWPGSGQRVAADGTQVGGDLALTGLPGNAIALNTTVNRTLRLGTQTVSGTSESEVFGIELGPDGAPVEAATARLTNAGPDGSTTFATGGGVAAARTGTNQWVIVWVGDDTVPGDNEIEIFARSVTSSAAGPGLPPPPPKPVKAPVTPGLVNLTYNKAARRYQLKFTYRLPAGVLRELCVNGCTAVAQLRNRAKKRTFATTIAGDGKVVLGVRSGLKATTGKALVITIPTTKAKLQRLGFTTLSKGALRRANIRLRVTLTTPTGTAVTAFDGQLQVQVARLRSGAIPAGSGILKR